MKTWIGTVELDEKDGDQILIFPDELFDELGWKEGDTLSFTLQEDQSVIIKKKV